MTKEQEIALLKFTYDIVEYILVLEGGCDDIATIATAGRLLREHIVPNFPRGKHDFIELLEELTGEKH